MPDLQHHLSNVDAELGILAGHAQSFAAGKSQINSSAQFTLEDELLLEGLLSRTWQCWNKFCRNCVIDSCLGTVNSAGNPIPALPFALSEGHVTGAAIQAKRQKLPVWGNINSVMRVEPTWGDVDVLTRIVTDLLPNNAPTLHASISATYVSAKALQVIRNCAAHNHHQSFADVQALRSAYIVFPISHPTHAMFWLDPGSNDYLINNIIDDLRQAAVIAVS